jgi:glycosyltransferase involved in cell wall biosynthesis
MDRRLTVVQMLPALNSGGVEQGTLDLSKYLVENGHRSIVIAKPGKMAEELLADGGELIPWSIGEKSILTFGYILKVRSLLINQGVDILHLRSRLPAWIGYFAWKSIKQGSRPKLVTTVHGPYSVNGYSSVMTKGEHVIAVSEMIKQYILFNYPKIEPQVLSVIHRGVDPEKFPVGYKPALDWMSSWYEQYPQTKGKKLLTMPGRLTRWKGQVDFIKAFAKISQQYPDVHGLIVGGYDRRRKQYVEDLKALVARLGIQDKLTLTGVRHDLKEIMSISAITYSLSNEPEAFGRTTLESLMLGVPVIAYAHGGVKEQMDIMFSKGSVGLGDVELVIKKTIKFLERPPEVSPSKEFELSNMLYKTLDVYKS